MGPEAVGKLFGTKSRQRGRKLERIHGENHRTNFAKESKIIVAGGITSKACHQAWGCKPDADTHFLTPSLLPQLTRIAKLATYLVLAAARHSRFACSAAVPDEHVAYVAPLVLRELSHQPLLDGGDGCVFGGEGEAFAEAVDVGVDDEAGVDVEGVAEDDVGGFSRNAAEGEKLVHGLRHLALEVLHERGHGGVDGLGFVAKEADGFDVGFDLVRHRRGEGGGRGEGFEKRGRDFVDGDVGGLCRENGGDEQLVRRGVIEFTDGVWVMRVQGG